MYSDVEILCINVNASSVITANVVYDTCHGRRCYFGLMRDFLRLQLDTHTYIYGIYVFVSKPKAHTGSKLISGAETLLSTQRSYVIFSIKSFAFTLLGNRKYFASTQLAIVFSSFLFGCFVEKEVEEKKNEYHEKNELLRKIMKNTLPPHASAVLLSYIIDFLLG